MLRSLRALETYKISAVDGDIGKVSDLLFDDHHFTTRYLVTDTSGFWEGPNKVLISPISFRQVDWSTHLFHLALTRAKVKNSPSVDLHKPVSRQYERDYSNYYGWPYYWGYGDYWAWGLGDYPLTMADTLAIKDHEAHEEAAADHHLRSAQEVARYHVSGSDGKIGHIADFIIDDETWAIRYLVIDTSNWWVGKKVLVAPGWAKSISWAEHMVYLNLTKDQIKNSPTWDPEALVNREYEERLYNYYGQPRYWARRETPAKPGQVAPTLTPPLSIR